MIVMIMRSIASLIILTYHLLLTVDKCASRFLYCASCRKNIQQNITDDRLVRRIVGRQNSSARGDIRDA